MSKAKFLGLMLDSLHTYESENFLFLYGCADGVVLLEVQQTGSHIIALSIYKIINHQRP